MASTQRLVLPKSILEMKFMLKTKERLNREKNQKDCDRLYSNTITNEMRHASEKNIFESSFTFCEDLIEGRVSFKGMNPEIERLMELESNPNGCNGDMQKDVSDEALAKNMKKLSKRGSSSFKDCVPNKKKKHS